MVYVVLGVFKLQNAAKIFSPLRCRTQKWHWKMKQLRCCIFLLFISFRITFGMLHHAPKVVGMRLSIQPATTLCINMHHNELHDVTCDHCILLRLKIFSISCRYDVLTHFAWIHVCIFIHIYIHIFFQHNWIHIQPTRKKTSDPPRPQAPGVPPAVPLQSRSRTMLSPSRRTRRTMLIPGSRRRLVMLQTTRRRLQAIAAWNQVGYYKEGEMDECRIMYRI